MLNALRNKYLLALVILAATACTRDREDGVPAPRGVSPLNTTYSVDGSLFTLRDGHFETPAAPGSAATVSLSVFGTPAYGELDDEREADAAVLLVYQGGGSGTFYYLAAAIAGEDGYRGTNAVLLGDRLSPQFVRIQKRVLAAGFRDRRPAESFASTPTIEVIRYAILDEQTLIPVPSESEQSGWVSFDDDVQVLTPCRSDNEAWLAGQSPALAEIRASYARTVRDTRPSAPLFMVLSGSFIEPRDDFGANYDSAFFATKLIDARPAGNCRDEFIVIEAPTAGAVIKSGMLIKGRARGNWFYEGDLPLVLEDDAGNELSRSFVTAQGEWMTKEFVPFTGTLSFTSPDEDLRGKLIFRKDNPTDRRELDDSTAIPVIIGAGPPAENHD